MDDFTELFSFQGRANRLRYFLHVLMDDFVIALLAVLIVVLGVFSGTPLFALPLVGLLVGGVVAATAISVKRLHDLNMSGWHVLGFMVPLYNIYLGLKMTFVKGTPGPNRFGADPLAPLPMVDDGYEVYEIEAP